MTLDPLSSATRAALGAAIDGFLDGQRARLTDIGAEGQQLLALARESTAGGKRLRPAACLAGWLCAAEAPAGDNLAALLRAAASLDVLHCSALVHDDVMDDSATRRGNPATHRRLADEHAAQGGRGGAEEFGRAGAILLGDLLVMWSAEMFEGCGLDVAAARPYLEAMRTEVTVGQFLDVTAQTREPADPGALADAERVVEYKTARYTVVRPVQIGAALAGADAETLAALELFGSPIGRAFQFRDDLLGVWGDEAKTGKPAGDDLREGKRTVLVAHAFRGLTGADADRLDALLGDKALDAHGVAEARSLIERSGAREAVEAMIAAERDEALRLLTAAPIRREGRTALTALVRAAVDREF